MGRLTVIVFVVVVGISLMVPLQLSAQQPTVYGPNNSSSVVFWYLGGITNCCSGMTNLYWTQSVLTVVPLNDGNPSPSIYWSTDSPTKLSIQVSPDGLTAVLTAKDSSSFGAPGYDIHVTAEYDGYPSNPFPVFINTPYTMTTSTDIASYTCGELGNPASWVGYGNQVAHGIADLLGNTLTPINVKESLEKRQWLNSSYANVTVPVATPWYWSQWEGNTFIDTLTICASTPNPLVPPPTNYNPNGTTAVFNETQKFWVGTATDYTGACVQRGVVTLYTDHGRVSPYYTPIVNKGDCTPGQLLN